MLFCLFTISWILVVLVHSLAMAHFSMTSVSTSHNGHPSPPSQIQFVFANSRDATQILRHISHNAWVSMVLRDALVIMVSVRFAIFIFAGFNTCLFVKMKPTKKSHKLTKIVQSKVFDCSNSKPEQNKLHAHHSLLRRKWRGDFVNENRQPVNEYHKKQFQPDAQHNWNKVIAR